MSNHINAKKGEIASVVLMPGDIKRCEYIATKYLTDAKIVNTLRANIAYTGYYKDTLVTIFPSGMGIGSAGIYSYELYKEYDVDTIIRIGTCGSYKDNIKVGSLFICDSAYSNSSYHEELMDKKCDAVASSENINNILKNIAKNMKIKLRRANVYTVEAFYANINKQEEIAKKKNLLLADMETYAIFSNAKYCSKNAVSLLTVSDIIVSSKQKNMSGEERCNNVDNMIFLALEAVYNMNYMK